MEVVSVAMIGIAAMILCNCCKEYANWYSVIICMATGLCIMFFMAEKISAVINFILEMVNIVNIKSQYIEILCKMTGITYITEFAVNICKDGGYASIGSQIENFGKIAVLYLSIPVLQALVELIQSLW